MSRFVVAAAMVVAVVGLSPAVLQAVPDTWDSRLDTLGVYYTEANVGAGTWYWRLTSGVFEDENESGGTHHIYYKALDANGNPIENQKTWAAWPTGNPTSAVYQFTKGAFDGYWANYGMAGGNWCPYWPEGPHGPYGAYIDGPSDEVWGMGMPCNVHVSYRLIWQWTQKSGGSPVPAITLNPTSLSASATQGSSPANQSFTVQNTGTGTLSYSISDNVSWLSVSPTSGTSTGEADTITVTYATSGLTAGTYSATITVSDPNAGNNPQTVAVSLTINPSGTAVSEDFETMPSWSSSFDAAWGNAANWSIVAGGQSGNCLQTQRTAPGSSSKAKVYSIAAYTDYTISIYIKCPSGSSYWAECAYRLGSYTAQDFDANAGSWTMIQKFASDGTNGNGNTWTQYTQTFNSGSSTQLSVAFKLGSSSGTGPTLQWDTLRVAGGAPVPTIALSPTSLSPSAYTGASPAAQSFTVQNSGSGTLSYSISDNASWLSVTPTSGASTGEADTITVNYSTASLAAGTYNATITVSDPNASNNPQTVAVTLTVLARPTITRSPATLAPSCTQGQNAANQSFTVQNTGGSSLSYTISDNVAWLSCSPTSGTSTGEADTITVTYSTSGLTAGTYSGTITISDPNATNNPQTIAVTLTVNAPLPTITRSPSTLAPSCTQGQNASNQTFTVRNTGGGTLSYSIGDNVSWLSCSPTSGTSTGETDTITVTYSTSGLTAGTYSGTITISDPNATNNPQTIAVTLTVNPSKLTVAEDFNSMPSWSSSYDASWGSAATWSVVAGGQSGNCLQTARSTQGSSSKVKVYSITASQSYTISIWIKCPSFGGSYWAECARRLGSYTAQNFDESSGSWTMIKKFSNTGTNGNGNVWTQYSNTFNSSSNTQISVGYKLGSSGGAGPTVQWDTLRIQ